MLTMEQIPAKTILTTLKYDTSGWFGVDHNMNLYKGCCHGCIYCDSRSRKYHVEDFDEVRVKENCLSILEDEIKRKRIKGIVSIGAMSDCYNPFERELEVTRGGLIILDKYRLGIALATKSDLVCRDIDILKMITEKSSCIVKMTITTSDDDLSKIIEPNVCVSSKRFKAVKELTDNGIFAGILLMPVLPFITDSEDNIKNIVRMAHEHGARFIIAMFGVTLRDIQREYYLKKMTEHFPDLIGKYLEYGDRYHCPVRDQRRLESIFIEECERYGILHKMEDVIKGYKKTDNSVQSVLF